MVKYYSLLLMLMECSMLHGQETVQVPGIAQITLAGAPAGATISGYSDASPLDSPIQVNLSLAAGEGVQIQATGAVGISGSAPGIPPDGSSSLGNTTTAVPNGGGISAIKGPQGALVAVFAGDNVVSNNRPPDVDFSGSGKDIAVLTPMLQQPFFVGSGTGPAGLKTYVVPAGATRLFLGVLGFVVSSNRGGFTAKVNIMPVPQSAAGRSRVYGVAQITLAGAAPGTTISGYSDTAPLNSPIPVNVPLVAGQGVQIQATGAVGISGSAPGIPPDGSSSLGNTTTAVPNGGGISAIKGPQGALVGVFTGNNVNSNNRPPDVDFSGAAQNVAILRPMLQQPFFVGSGTGPDGIKTYVVPSGATRLFLGVLGFVVSSNSGEFAVTVSIVPIPQIATNPLRVYGVGQIILAGASAGTTISGYSDTTPEDVPLSDLRNSSKHWELFTRENSHSLALGIRRVVCL
jgi:hypothetical protein